MLPADALTINSLIINIKSSPLQNMKINNRDGKGYLSTRQTKSTLDLSVYFGGRKKKNICTYAEYLPLTGTFMLDDLKLVIYLLICSDKVKKCRSVFPNSAPHGVITNFIIVFV